MLLTIGSLKIEQVLSIVTEQIGTIARTMSGFPQENKGGYLCIMRKTDGVLLFLAHIGFFPKGNWLMYGGLAQEKAQRLLGHQGHISSWQSRDVNNLKYGGAIAAGEYILSFSGLPELADELVMIGLAKSADLINHEDAVEIATISSNTHYFNNVLVG